ncbi:MAG: hypothetical protein AAF787_06160 [Chloroflexota bacterium]
MNDNDQAGCYKIHVKGHLSQHRATRFSGTVMTLTKDGTTLIVGTLVDQAALHGLLRTIRDSGLELLAVNQTESQEYKEEKS